MSCQPNVYRKHSSSWLNPVWTIESLPVFLRLVRKLQVIFDFTFKTIRCPIKSNRQVVICRTKSQYCASVLFSDHALWCRWMQPSVHGRWQFPTHMVKASSWCCMYRNRPLCYVWYPAAGSSSYKRPVTMYRMEQTFPWALQQFNFHGRARCDLRVSIAQWWASAPAAIHYLKLLIHPGFGGHLPLLCQKQLV